MFKEWICKCFGINTKENNNETICFNQIKQIIIVETVSKFPDINNKWNVISFFDSMNRISETILGNTIEFIIENPNEIPYKNTKDIKYTINNPKVNCTSCARIVSLRIVYKGIALSNRAIIIK